MKRVAGGQPVFGDVIMIGTVENETSSGNPYEVLKEDELLKRISNNYEDLTEKTGPWNFLKKILERYV